MNVTALSEMMIGVVMMGVAQGRSLTMEMTMGVGRTRGGRHGI